MKALPLLCSVLVFACAIPSRAQNVDTFGTNINGTVRAIGVQSDGKVIIGGAFTTVGAAPRNRLARFNADGSLDDGFNPGANADVLAIVVQADDKIVLGGNFSSVAGTARSSIARLNSNGTLDTTFNPGANGGVRDLALQADGRIVVGGNFTTLAGQPRNYIGRLEATGALDGSFNPNANGQVNTIVVQSDGRIVAGGFFTAMGGQTRNYLARVGSNGALDAGFNPNGGGTVWRLALQADGQIIVGGTFSSLGGQVRSNIARLQITGAVDPAFNPAANNIVNSLIVRPDGKVIAAGNFTGMAGQPRGYIASINSDGTLDSTFTPAANATIFDLFQDPAGRLYVGGDFTTFGGQARTRVARVNFGLSSNDNFANSAPLTGLKHFVLTENLGSASEPGEPSHWVDDFGNPFGPVNTVWWSWAAPASIPVVFDTTGTGNRPILAVYTGNAVNNLTLVASNFFDNLNSSSRSKVGFHAISGQVYRIVVDNAPAGMLVLSMLAGAETGNDFFVNASNISAGTVRVTGSNLNATTEPNEPEHSFNNAGRSVWWRWTAQTNGPVTLDTAGSSFSPGIAVYTGTSIGSLSLVVEDDDFLESSVTFQGVAGTIYRIAIFDENDSGDIVLNFRQRPANDSFANGILLSGSTFTTTGENRGATQEIGEPNHANANGNKSVWWRWTAPSSGLFTLDTVGSSFKPALAVYTGGTLTGLTPIGNHDGSSGSASRVRFSAAQGTTYQFAVDGDFYGNQGGDIVLRIAPAEGILLANDNFANRIQITQLPAVVHGANIGATSENDEPFFGISTLWWSFIAPSNGLATIYKLNGVPELRFLALQGTSLPTLVTLAENLIDFIRFECAIDFQVRAGETYFVCVDSGGIDQGDFSLSLALTPAPPNDNFANRIVIPPNTPNVTGTTLAATVEPGEPPGGTNSIWWSYTPAVSGPIILTTVGSAIDTFLGVYTGSALGGLAQVTTNDVAYFWPALSGPTNDRPSRVRFNGVAGQSYRIKVSTARDAAGAVQLNFPTLAIEDIVSLHNTLQPNRTVNFTANLRLTNLRNAPSGPLRLRLFARAGYSHLEGLFEDCGKDLPAMNVEDQELTIVDLGPPGFLSAQSSLNTVVSGACPPPHEAADSGQGWGAMAVLEELTEDGWEVRDSRLLIFGNWPRVGGFVGPGGGVVTIASGMGQVLSTPGFIDVSVGPPAAVRLGARWRVTPGNCGSVCNFTNFTDQRVTLVTRKVDFTIDVNTLPGFKPPTNQTIRLRAGLVTPLDLIYEVNPPQLFYHRTTGLSITGTPGTAYRIEGSSRVHPATWSSNAGRTLSAGQNVIPNTAPAQNTNRFYRAFWLSN